MIINNITELEEKLNSFNKHNCIVIICRYNGGKSSIATDLIHHYFGEENTYYATFIDQSKPNFTSRESRLKFDEIVSDKIVIFDEIDDEKRRDVETYLKRLIENNIVIILTNPYGSSNDSEKEIRLFKKHEQNILPENTLFIFVKQEN